jgi:hypothetical protein
MFMGKEGHTQHKGGERMCVEPRPDPIKLEQNILV